MTILNSVDVIKNFDWFGVIILTVVVILLTIFGVFLLIDGESFGCFVLMCAIILGGVDVLIANQPIGYQYTKIEAVITDDTLPVDFIDKYKVLDHRGDIYELKYIDPEKMKGLENDNSK